MTKKVKGFKNNEAKIAKKEGIPMKNAGAILANAGRNASKAAKKNNLKLMRIKGNARGR